MQHFSLSLWTRRSSCATAVVTTTNSVCCPKTQFSSKWFKCISVYPPLSAQQQSVSEEGSSAFAFSIQPLNIMICIKKQKRMHSNIWVTTRKISGKKETADFIQKNVCVNNSQHFYREVCVFVLKHPPPLCLSLGLKVNWEMVWLEQTRTDWSLTSS